MNCRNSGERSWLRSLALSGPSIGLWVKIMESDYKFSRSTSSLISVIRRLEVILAATSSNANLLAIATEITKAHEARAPEGEHLVLELGRRCTTNAWRQSSSVSPP